MTSLNGKESHTECNCCQHQTVPSTHQTLDEMQFEKGIWDAVLSKEVGRVRKFIKEGKEMDRDNYGYTALHYASRGGSLEICQILLSEGRVEVNAVTNGGVTALHRASAMGHLEIVKLLVEHGADVTIQDNDGQTALHRAAAAKHQQICEYLIKTNVSLKTIVDQKQKTPWEYISDDAEQISLKFLLKPNA